MWEDIGEQNWTYRFVLTDNLMKKRYGYYKY